MLFSLVIMHKFTFLTLTYNYFVEVRILRIIYVLLRKVDFYTILYKFMII